jgi:Excreted virulence factor EspC, type VII ESX diderm
MSAPLNVSPADVDTFADQHADVGTTVAAASNSATPAVAELPTALGPVGAPFTAAVAEFDAAFKAAASDLAGGYHTMATQLNTVSATYVTTDNANGQRIKAAGYSEPEPAPGAAAGPNATPPSLT